MKRYDIVARLGHDYHGPYAFSAEIPDEDGPFVLHSEAQAEIERLQAISAEWERRATAMSALYGEAVEQRDKSVAEIERLRGLVREAYEEGIKHWGTMYDYDLSNRWLASAARKQLGDKP